MDQIDEKIFNIKKMISVPHIKTIKKSLNALCYGQKQILLKYLVRI